MNINTILDLNAAYSSGTNYINNNYHRHDMYEIFTPITSNTVVYVENNTYNLNRGDFMCINNHENHKIPNFDDMDNMRLTISFFPEYMRILSTETTDLLSCFEKRDKGKNNLIHFEGAELEKILDICNQIINFNNHDRYGNDIYAVTYFIRLLIELNLVFSKKKTYAADFSSNKLSPLVQYIDLHYKENITLDSVSRDFCVNKNYINRIFKSELNTTFHKYIISRRISTAKYLIIGGHSLTDVCYMCGFQNYASFFRAFKAETDYSPIDYKKTY